VTPPRPPGAGALDATDPAEVAHLEVAHLEVAHLEVAAVLTDLDGVLVDSTASVERAWRAWARRVAIDEVELLATLHGRRAVDTVRRVAPDHNLATELAWLEAAELELVAGTVEVAGAGAFVTSLPTDRWAVVTSGTHAVASSRIATVGLPLPRVLVTADDVAAGKPDPEGYRLAADRLGVDPTACLVLEDAPAGIEAARAAGCHVLAVATSHPVDALTGADGVVAAPASLRAQATADGVRIEIRGG
jgi:sugar-phosphatase